jgi:hypothetical protein
MARPKRLPDPTSSVQELLEQKAKHTEALNRINETLSRIGSMLGGNGRSAPRRCPGRPPASATAATGEEAPAGGRRRRRRKRGKFAISGEQSIIDFVREHRNPATSAITAHWRSEGRGGKADNALSRLVKLRRLKRQAIPGERGSRYLIA